MKTNKVNKHLIPTQKEKNIFFANASVGIAGSLLAGLAGASFYDIVTLVNPSISWRISYSLMFVIATIGLMFFFSSKIKKINK